jgi:hypothetical protein
MLFLTEHITLFGIVLLQVCDNPVKKTELMAGGICCPDHATPSNPQKLALTSPTSSGRSVGIIRLQAKGHGV